MQEIQRYACDSVTRLLVGNKCDLIEKKIVDTSTAREYADSVGIPFLETSAKSSANVEQAFMIMASEIKKLQGGISSNNSNYNNSVVKPSQGAPVKKPRGKCDIL